jgi:uncharacterized membrane protein YgcG
MTAMQPGRIPLYLMHGNVLRAAHPGQCFVEEDEDMVDCGLQLLQGDAAMEAMKVSKRKGGDTGCHPTAPELLVVQCSSKALDDGGEQEESITPPFFTPWTYTNSYGCALLLQLFLCGRTSLRSGSFRSHAACARAARPTRMWPLRRRYSWPEACAVLDLAVEDSRKQKRRGTPNAVVLAGMSLPEPFAMPLQMPKNHVRFLHRLQSAVRVRAGMPPPKPEAKVDAGALPLHTVLCCDVLRVLCCATPSPSRDGIEPALHADAKAFTTALPVEKALAHPSLNPPEGHIVQLEALRQYLLQLEHQLWGVLDQGWTCGMEFRRRFLANALEARTPLLLARLLLVLVDAVRPAVAEKIFTKEWSYMDVDLCPGGFAILDPVRALLRARALLLRAPSTDSARPRAASGQGGGCARGGGGGGGGGSRGHPGGCVHRAHDSAQRAGGGAGCRGRRGGSRAGPGLCMPSGHARAGSRPRARAAAAARAGGGRGTAGAVPGDSVRRRRGR